MSLEQKPKQLERRYPPALRIFIGLYVLSWLVLIGTFGIALFPAGVYLAVLTIDVLLYLGTMLYAKIKDGIDTWGEFLLYTIIPFAAVVLIIRWAARGRTETVMAGS